MMLFKVKDEWLRLIVALVFIVVSTVSGNAAEQGTPDLAKGSATTIPAAPAALPLEEVSSRAMQVDHLIRGFAKNLADPEIATIEKFLPQVRANLALELKSTTNILNEKPSLETLQSQEEIWQQKRLQLTEWLSVLTGRTTKLQAALTQLKNLHDVWSKTRDAEEASNAPDPILQQINRTLTTIRAAQQPYITERDRLLDLQSKVAEEMATCNMALSQIGALQQMAAGGLLTPENPPIWDIDLAAGAKLTLSSRLPQVAAAYRADILQYIRDPSRHMRQHAAILIVLSLMLWAAKRRVPKEEATGNRPEHGSAVFDHVFAGALLLTLMIASEPSSPAPATVKRLFQIAALAPIIILTRRVVLPFFVPAIYALAVLLVIDALRGAIAGDPSTAQGILVLEAIIGIAVLSCLLVSGGRQPAQFFGRTVVSQRLLNASILVVLCVGLLAAVLGYMRLARVAIPGVLAGGALALELYASLQVAMALIAYALRVPPFNLLKLVQHHREFIVNRIYCIGLWLITAGWLARYLDYLGLLQPVQSMAAELLSTRLEKGSISISIGDIGAFILTVFGAYLVSSFIRFVLEEDIYPRTGVAKGRSYAFSSLLNYTIIAAGFVLAIGFLGVDMTKMTVLAGAFGVGIGFGLQSVVNNFVSGLILLFERPIQVGDSVQVGNLQGRVRQIGIRASIVSTWQGAEIIVPNANLITQEVTNWTLTDELRRLDLAVGVNYGAAPRKVIELLERAAHAHSDVLKHPAPRCLFMGYGESSINFELRVWTEYSKSLDVRSDLCIDIYDAIYAAGMSFPFPQREVRLLNDGNPGSSLRP